MGTAEKIAAIIKEQALKGDVYCEETDSVFVSVLNSAPEQVKTFVSFGAGIRVINGNKSAFGFVTSKEENIIKKTITKLKENAFAEGFDNYEFGESGQAPLIKADDGNYGNIGAKRLTKAALEMEEAALKFSPRVKYVRDTSVSASKLTVSYASTSGANFFHTRSFYSAMISAIAYDGHENEAQTADSYMTSCVFDKMRFAETGKKAADIAVKLLGSSAIKTGKYALILSPMFACDFLSLLSKMFLGNNVARGKSLLCGKKHGDKIASSALTLNDSPHLEMEYGSRGFDAEGTMTKNKVLIDKGIFQEILHDKKSAFLLGVKSTGNCVRQDFRSFPECGPMNFHIAKGDCEEKILSSNMSGIYVTSLMGLHTADTASGNYSLGINGFLYEKGKFIQPVRDAIASGSLSDMLLNVSCVCDDLEFYGNFGSPTIVVENVTIAGK